MKAPDEQYKLRYFSKDCFIHNHGKVEAKTKNTLVMQDELYYSKIC